MELVEINLLGVVSVHTASLAYARFVNVYEVVVNLLISHVGGVNLIQ